MGNITVTKWQCDRCREIEESMPDQTSTPIVLITLPNLNNIEWRELCIGCQGIVSALVEPFFPPPAEA